MGIEKMGMRSNKAFDTDTQVRPRLQRSEFLGRRSTLRYASAVIALRA